MFKFGTVVGPRPALGNFFSNSTAITNFSPSAVLECKSWSDSDLCKRSYL